MSVSRLTNDGYNRTIIYMGVQLNDSNISNIFQIYNSIHKPDVMDRARFLDVAHRCAIHLKDDTGFFSEELDVFIENVLRLCPDDDENSPLLRLHQENWQRERAQRTHYLDPAQCREIPRCQFKILEERSSDTNEFLNEVYKYGKEIFDNNRHVFNQDLDSFIKKAIMLAEVDLDASHPLVLLHAENQNRPKVTTPKSILKTNVVN